MELLRGTPLTEEQYRYTGLAKESADLLLQVITKRSGQKLDPVRSAVREELKRGIGWRSVGRIELGGEPEAGYRPPGATGSAPGAPPIHRALDLQA